MKTQYMVWRHHNLIFTGSMNQVKRFLISKPEFANYKKAIRRAEAVRGNLGDRWHKTLTYVCCMTEYCSIRAIDRREKVLLLPMPESQYEVLDTLVDQQKANFKKIGLI